jgi:thioredoxin 1
MPTDLTSENQGEFINETSNTIIDFSAKWCGPCKQMKPHFEKVEEFMTHTNTELNFVTIDVDDEEDLALQYNIQGMPTLVLLENGTEVDRHVGFMKGIDMLTMIGKHFTVTTKKEKNCDNDSMGDYHI